MQQLYYEEIYQNNDQSDFRNEFLFFIKPEITVQSETIRIDSILRLIFSKINEFNLIISDARIISAKYLDDYNIIAQHYGVINKLAKDPEKYLSEDARNKFFKLHNLSVDEANVLGSLEAIEKYPSLTPVTLDYLCQNTQSEKLAGGTYMNEIKLDGNKIFLINGFHPRQLEHFTTSGRSIIAFTLCGDTDWSSARNNFTGKTNPAEAVKGSIRNELLLQKDKFGLNTVTSSWNGIHLSAGPVEGLVELVRYNSDFSRNIKKSYLDFSFGRRLAARFTESEIECILANRNMIHNEKILSPFDLTEELNSDDAAEILKQSSFQD